MTAAWKPEGPRASAKVSPTQRRIREDREDRAALDKARDALDAGTLQTTTNVDLKARLGLD